MGFIKLAMDGSSFQSQDQAISKFKLPEGQWNTIGRDNQEQALKRIEPIKLERIYRRDPISFNSINKYVQLIMAPGYEVSHDKKKIRDYFNNMFKYIGTVGEPLTIDELFDSIYRNELIYGNAFVYLIPDKNDKKIVDLTSVDPKDIDYLKDEGGNVIMDQDGKPAGFVVKTGYANIKNGDPLPRGLELMSNINIPEKKVFIKYERISHFKLYEVGNRFWGTGLIEPAYQSILRKLNMEEGQANSIYKSAFNPLIGYVGSDRKVATPKDLDYVNKLLSQLTWKKTLSLPDWVKVDPVKYEQSNIVPETLEYMRINQIAPTGMPMAIASGKGDATNRSTLNIHLEFLEFTIEEIVRKTIATFEKKVLKRVADKNNAGDYPHIKWNPVGPHQKDFKVDKLISAAKEGVISLDEAREEVTRILGIEQIGDLKEKEKKPKSSKKEEEEEEKEEKPQKNPKK